MDRHMDGRMDRHIDGRMDGRTDGHKTQLLQHFENYLSPISCGYRKGFSAQFALISLIENWKKILDKNGLQVPY